MDTLQIAGIGMIGAILALTLKKWQPELSIMITIAAGIIIIMLCFNYLENIFMSFERIISRSGIEPQYLKLVTKLIGIAYITKFSSDICRDAGEAAIAEKIDFAGKITVFSLTMPIMSAFLDAIIQTINTF